MMRRREFITLLGGVPAWPLVARAQQPATPVVGYLNSTSPEGYARQLVAFRQGLAETGYRENQNVTFQYRWANGHYDELSGLAADLVRVQVSVIAAMGGVPPALAAKAATSKIPIVFVTGVDPIQAGLVVSLSRPGGNLTGVANLNVELGPKRLELLHELLPPERSVAALVNLTNPLTPAVLTELKAAARILGRQLHILHAANENDIEAAFASVSRLRAGGLVVGTDALFNAHMEELAALGLQHAVPTIFQFREFAAAGGLMSYGGNATEAHRLAGVYVGRILHGEKVTDLPVQQPTKVELVINMKTAKALGVTIPIPIRARAEELIE
jgi:putative ABC transport system substrate-binding protein